MSPGDGVRLLIGRVRGRLRRCAVADTVEYVVDTVPDQLPSTRVYGSGRLGDQVLVPMWGGVCYPSVFRRAAGEGPTATILKGPVQLRDSFSLRTLLSTPLCSPCRMVAAVLYTHTQPPAMYLGRRRSASERVEFRPFTRATVRACCSRTSSYACCRSRARSQQARWSRSRLWCPPP